MSAQLSGDQQLLRQAARRLAEGEFRPRAFKWDGRYPEENERALREQGLLGVSLPEAYGGGGLTLADEVMVIEEIGRVCPETAMLMTLAGPPRILAEVAPEHLKQRYIRGFCQEGRKIAVAISEAEAGSAMNELHTRATPDGSMVRIQGEKLFISHAEVSAAFLVFVRFEAGIGAVIVDRDAPGFRIVRSDQNMAGHLLSSLEFNDCAIPADHVVISGANGFERLMQAFNNERCLSASWAVATALCALDMALEYAQQRKQFKRPIADFQGLQWMLAEMAMRVDSARLVVQQAAHAPTRLNSSMAKVVACEMVEKVVSDALQVFGATGYLKPHPMEFLYRLARGRRIAGGTVEVQKNSIARELLRKGLYRCDG
jgi:alkylation response protein AidB-like acyl-CoA dehydrogenase